jgi:hypothetical protein
MLIVCVHILETKLPRLKWLKVKVIEVDCDRQNLNW